MEDPNDPVSSNSSLQKKKSKKKKKKNGTKPEQEPQEAPKVDQEKQPQVKTQLITCVWFCCMFKYVIIFSLRGLFYCITCHHKP